MAQKQEKKQTEKKRRTPRLASITTKNRVRRLRREAKDAELKIAQLERRAAAGKPIGGVLEHRIARLRTHAERCRKQMMAF